MSSWPCARSQQISLTRKVAAPLVAFLILVALSGCSQSSSSKSDAEKFIKHFENGDTGYKGATEWGYIDLTECKNVSRKAIHDLDDKEYQIWDYVYEKECVSYGSKKYYAFTIFITNGSITQARGVYP